MEKMTQSDLQNAFHKIDQERVELPHDSQLDIDWDNLELFGWRKDRLGFLVMETKDKPIGLIARFAGTEDQGQLQGVCSLCLSTRPRQGTSLALIDSWHQPRRSVGIHVCADLQCSLAVRRLTHAAHMGETIAIGQRIERFQQRLANFVKRVIDCE